MSKVTPLPSQFLENCKAIIPYSEFDSFVASFELPIRTSVRYNPFKNSPKEGAERVEWCSEGYFLEQRKQFTLDPQFHGGGYYVQEASSMFLEQAYSAALPYLPTSAIKALDLCGAPGGKSTHLATLVGCDGLVVANEVIRSRAKILEENIIKWGSGNVVVTNNDPSVFGSIPSFFNLMLIDAPCSGEGMFRKDSAARAEWSQSGVELCTSRTKRIIADCWDALAQDGVLVYSTCTFNPLEDEQMLDWIASNYEVESIPIAIQSSWGVTECRGESGAVGYKFLPHKCSGEGLFMALLVKREGAPKLKKSKKEVQTLPLCSKEEHLSLSKWIDSSCNFSFFKKGDDIYGFQKNWQNDIIMLHNKLNFLTFGVELGRFYGRELKPAHAVALFYGLNRDVVAQKELSKEQALDYLRKKEIDTTLLEQGMNIICYNGTPLGFIKRIGVRSNNLYPKNYRIYNL